MSRRRRSPQSDIFTTIVTELGKAIWFLISWPFRGKLSRRAGRLDNAVYTERWRRIRTLAEAGDEQHLRQAIMEADKLVDHAMKELGRSGETFGERVRTYESSWDRDVYHRVWEAHKLRNRLAHEVDVRLTKQQADGALMGFYSGLKRLGAL